MSKTTKIVIAVIAVIVVIVAVLLVVKPGNSENKEEETSNTQSSNLPETKSAEDLTTIVNKLYEGITQEMPMLETTDIDVNETDMVKMLTGLDNGADLEYLVVSQPMMSSQAYSLILAKVKNGVNANEIAKKMCDQVDVRRWICVSAEKVVATNSGDVVFMIMADAERLEAADAVYANFKKEAGTVGKEHVRTEEVTDELPPDMY